jgi:hypothetical protein
MVLRSGSRVDAVHGRTWGVRGQAPVVLERVGNALPKDFPQAQASPILELHGGEVRTGEEGTHPKGPAVAARIVRLVSAG